MSNDLLTAIQGFLSNAWRFFTDVTVPSTNITMGALALGLAIIPVALRFLSIAIGVNIGDAPADTGYGNPKTKSLTISDKRLRDTR